MADDFEQTLDRLGSESHEPRDFADSLVSVLPISGASVSTVGKPFGSETVSASDDLAAHLDELQFDFNEGPCWDAIASGEPVSEPSLASAPSQWPNFGPAAAHSGVASIFAFPLKVGALSVGAIDLYSRTPLDLTPADRRRALGMSEVIGRRVLRQALQATASEIDEEGGVFSRRIIHQATGMVLAQLDVSAEDATVIIQSHAYGGGRSMKDLARAIIAGEVRFARGATGIEMIE
jgi:hypothetical protein